MAKPKDDLYRLFDYDVDLTSRVIYLGTHRTSMDGEESGVDANLSEKTIKAIHTLGSLDLDGSKPINIYLNNVGGNDYHMLAMYDVIKACKSHITITVYGQAFSAASLILQAADTRILSPHSRVMIHLGTAGYYSHPKIVKAWADECTRVINDMEAIYLKRMQDKHPDFKLKQLQKMLDFDTILSAKEAVELGLADEILE